MGCFDTVSLRCPHCGKATAVQSKSGPCDLKTYNAISVPLQVAAGALGDDKCGECGKGFTVFARTPNVELFADYRPPEFDEEF